MKPLFTSSACLIRVTSVTFFLTLFITLTMQAQTNKAKSLYDFTMKDINGREVSFSQYKGKVLLIVSVASRCGYTPQYSELEALYRKYKDKGFVILGFPANNFLWQEPGSDAEIKEFCQRNYGVTFDMFSKISVKGKDKHPLYEMITSDENVKGDVKWNFQKYLVDRDGRLTQKFFSKVKPMSEEMTSAVELLLNSERAKQ